MKVKKFFFFNRPYIRHETNRIRSKNHNIVPYRINKTSLSFYDDKKYVLKDWYSRLSHFHKSTS